MSTSPASTILRVAVATPLRREFDYLPPAGVRAQDLHAGMRLRVPFGRSEMTGILLGCKADSPVDARRLKRARSVLDDQPVLDAPLLELLQWASRYYQHPLGDVIQQALPALLRQGRPARPRGIGFWQLTAAGHDCNPASLARAPRQQQLMQQLHDHPAGLTDSQLDELESGWRPVLKRLAEKGLVRQEQLACRPAEAGVPGPAGPIPTPNSAQQQAIDAVLASQGQYRAFLLDGVTGSGKTEIYLRLIEAERAAGRQTLVLVPEIGLTPQLLQRFEARLDTPVAVLHSGLNDQERLNAWLAARSGEAGVIIGTRSALFTPLAKPGLIIVDEEHDLSFKQQEGFRYSARDLAVVRARQLDIPVLLGSATPSLESLANVRAGRFTALHLPERAGTAQPPAFQLLDIRNQKLEHGLSAALLQRMREHLDAGSQVMLFINRRGFAPVLMCHSCGWHARCERCDAHMTVHRGHRRLRCHHCGSERPLPSQCPECESEDLIRVGYGTERVEQALPELFPDVPVLRVDRDSTRRKGALQAMLSQIAAGERQILVGTQMLAKGHHFPNLTLVGLLDADYGLFSADFRAAERLGQLVLQVAGRAGRAERPGEVLIQTHHPENPLLHSLLAHDYGRFAEGLLAEREAVQLPPFSHLALLRAEAVDAEAPYRFLEQARQAALAYGVETVEIYGPLPAPMERRAGRSRAQLLLQAPARAPLQNLLTPWLQQLETLKSGRKVRWSIDVDPQEML